MDNTKTIKRKAETLLKSIHEPQSRIYYFSSWLDDKNKPGLSQLATESGFELDISYQKMQELLDNLKSLNQ